MRKLLPLFIMLLFIVTPAAAIDFQEMSFSDDGVTVYAHASADVPWAAPFTENATVYISVWPIVENVTWTRVESVLITVHSAELDGSGYSLIASDVYDFSTSPEGGDHVNASLTVTLTGSGTGSQSYIAVSVTGRYGNATNSNLFTATSPENLLGPFNISFSPTSPQFLFGLVVIILFTIVIALGMIGVRRSRKRPTREALLKE
ncbi:MAG: hypothetical protein ACXADC_11150 [Candidatus Thorarchaeota archaeon]